MVQVAQPTISLLVDVITGEGGRSPHRTGGDLVSFFRHLGLHRIMGGQSRATFTKTALETLNGTGGMTKAISAAVDPRHFIGTAFTPEAVVDHLNKFLEYDGYVIVRHGKRYGLHLLGRDTIDFKLPFKASTPVMEQFISRQAEKCREKLSARDHDGAITNARSLLEAILVELEHQLTPDPRPYDGDLPKLYKRVRQALKMEEAAYKELEPVVQLLRGLTSVVDGLSGMSNKMADRHAITRQPAKHHAELAVNAAATVARFLVASFVHQRVALRSEPSRLQAAPSSGLSKTT